MRLDFYYFSYQCPLNDTIMDLLREYRTQIDIHCHDISQDRQLAKELQMFYPTLTILDGTRRYYRPLSRSFFTQVVAGIYPEEEPYLPRVGREIVTKKVIPLDFNHVMNACACCGNPTESNCTKKALFLGTTDLGVYGFIHRDETNELIGGVEYLPSELVPYDIPHDKSAAFLTCLYLTHPDYDYKTAPLQALEQYLTGQFEQIYAVTDEKGIFPNGDLEFFLGHGYEDQGIVFCDPHYCTLHLVSKRI